MYHVRCGGKIKSAFSISQAELFAKNFNHPTPSDHPTTIELPDGCILNYNHTNGDITSATFDKEPDR